MFLRRWGERWRVSAVDADDNSLEHIFDDKVRAQAMFDRIRDFTTITSLEGRHGFRRDFEWSCTGAEAVAAWKRLSPKEQAIIDKKFADVIEEATAAALREV